MIDWLKRVLGRGNGQDGDATVGDKPIRFDDLELVPSGMSQNRADMAMPGTAELEPLLTLVPPPLAPEFIAQRDDPEDRDYGPNPIAECVMRFAADGVFDTKETAAAIRKNWPDELKRPSYYVVTPEGRTTYLDAADSPPQGRDLIAGWQMYEGADLSVENVSAAMDALPGILSACVPDVAFSVTARDALEEKFSAANTIITLEPKSVMIVALPTDDAAQFDGKTVWNVLHAMGITWGDMDCFQWNDPTHQMDHLIWVEADDGEIGYVLPEEVAAGRQNFNAVRFSFEPARTPSPEHVLHEMLRATGCFQQQTGCRILAIIDDTPAEGADALQAAVVKLVRDLEALGVTPASSAVCMLR